MNKFSQKTSAELSDQDLLEHMDAETVAELLSCSTYTVLSLARDGHLRKFYIGRKIRILKCDVASFVRSRLTETSTQETIKTQKVRGRPRR